MTHPVSPSGEPGIRAATLVTVLAVIAAIGLAIFAFGVWSAFTATATATVGP